MSNKTPGIFVMMRRIFRFGATKSSGMSLVEVMIAMVILLFVALALMQTVTVAIDANMKNALMDEAVKVAGQSMSRMRNVSDPTTEVVNPPLAEVRLVRNASIRYLLTNTVTASGDLSIVNTTVSWTWKGQTYTHLVSTIRR